MSCIIGNGIAICGNFSKLRKGKPENWAWKTYKTLIPYPFRWRKKIGKVKCTCKEVIEMHQPYYGCTWLHSPDCALMKLIKEKPQLQNLICYQDIEVIATTDN